MARVFASTADVHCGGWRREVVELPTPEPRTGTGVRQHIDNTHKFDAWCRRVAEASDGERLLLIDADTFLLRPIDDIWDRTFDLAYAIKRQPFGLNLGVLFVRVSPKVKAFFEAWKAENAALFTPRQEPAEMRAWRMKHGGINQASFCRLRDAGGLEMFHVEHLSCREWNCEESAWERFDPKVTRIVHVKGSLRRQVFNREPVSFGRLVGLWKELEEQPSLVRATG